MTNENLCGISAMGFYLPEKRVPLKELAEKAGIPAFVAEYAGAETVREAAEGEYPSDMAIMAAKNALENGSVDPAEIDLIIYCGAGVPDHVMPSSAGKIQHEVGARNAYGFDLVQGCCGMLTGMQVAQAHIALNQGIDTVMLATGDKWSGFTHFHSADSVFFGDGGGAVIFKKGHPDLSPLSAEIVTKGEYHDLWAIPAGGLRHPASQETVANQMHTYICQDPDRARHEFKEIYVPVMLDTVHGALKKCGITPSQVGWFDMVNANLRVQEIVLENLGVPIERSSAEYLRTFGHFGSQDIFFNLDMAMREKKIKKGDYVVMLTTGIGFYWGSAVLRY